MHRTTAFRVLLVVALILALGGLAPGGQPVPVSAGTPIWTNIGPEGGPISALVINPENPSILYVATGSDHAGTGSRVFKSTDRGAHWEKTGLHSFYT